LLTAGDKPSAPNAGATIAYHESASPVATAQASPAVTPLTQFKVCIYPATTCTGYSAGYMKTEPAKIITSADGSGLVQNLTWSGWGSATALGTGTLEIDDCNPNCAQGTYTGYPATVTLTNLTPYGNEKQAYADMEIRAPSAPYPAESFTTGLVP